LPPFYRLFRRSRIERSANKKWAEYNSLGSSSDLLNELPVKVGKKYHVTAPLPIARVMAFGSGHKARGLGTMRLVDALKRVARSGIAAYALVNYPPINLRQNLLAKTNPIASS